MEAKFWLDKWTRNEIGFHEQSVHPLLTTYWSDVRSDVKSRSEKQIADCTDPSNVFVPLCGKSLDLLWLRAQGHHVYGIELSEIAVEAFFSENNIAFTRTKIASLVCYAGENMTLWCGDYFSLRPDMLPAMSLFYDRAALVALAPSSREAYLDHLASLVASSARGLLITLEYEHDLINPPPHSIPPKTVDIAYSANFSCEPLGSGDAKVKGKPCTEHALIIRVIN